MRARLDGTKCLKCERECYDRHRLIRHDQRVEGCHDLYLIMQTIAPDRLVTLEKQAAALSKNMKRILPPSLTPVIRQLDGGDR